jgi:uncharacterized membrane protein YgdD (TMEM256/DUF423 family)
LTRTPDRLIVVAALSAALAIAAGAFAAHMMTGQAVEWLRTGMQYQLAHAIAAVGLAHKPAWRNCAWMMLGGAALFAASLYLMALGAPRWLGAITPIGGLAMIGGWLWLVIKEIRYAAEHD